MSTDLDALLREVRERLASEADPKRAAFGEGYHVTAMRIRGVRTPVLRQLAADLARRVEEPSDAVELASGLVATDGYSERTLAYILLSRQRTALASLHADRSRRSAGATTTGGPSMRSGRSSPARRGSPDNSTMRASNAGRARPTAGGVVRHSFRPPR